MDPGRAGIRDPWEGLRIGWKRGIRGKSFDYKGLQFQECGNGWNGWNGGFCANICLTITDFCLSLQTMGRKQTPAALRITNVNFGLRHRDCRAFERKAHEMGLTRHELLEALLHGVLNQLSLQELAALLHDHVRLRGRYQPRKDRWHALVKSCFGSRFAKKEVPNKGYE